MSFRFHPEAAHELREAVEYYEDIDRPGYNLSVEVCSARQLTTQSSHAGKGCMLVHWGYAACTMIGFMLLSYI
jgi:hypothetical protein